MHCLFTMLWKEAPLHEHQLDRQVGLQIHSGCSIGGNVAALRFDLAGEILITTKMKKLFQTNWLSVLGLFWKRIWNISASIEKKISNADLKDWAKINPRVSIAKNYWRMETILPNDSGDLTWQWLLHCSSRLMPLLHTDTSDSLPLRTDLDLQGYFM